MADAVTDPQSGPRAGVPASGPDGLMIFDGVCNFCSANVRLLLHIDRAGAIRFASMQSPYGSHLAARHGLDPADPSTFVFFEAGRALFESDAVLAMLARLPVPWRWLRAVRHVPRPWRDAAYCWIARNRYRLFGRRDACMVPSPADRARFVEAIPPGEA